MYQTTVIWLHLIYLRFLIFTTNSEFSAFSYKIRNLYADIIHPFCCFPSCHIIVSALTKLRWCMQRVSLALLSDLNAHTMDQPAANSVSLCLWPLQCAQNKVQVSVVQLIYNGEQAVIKCWCQGIPHHSFGESSSLYPNKTNGPLAGCNLSHVHVPSNHMPLLLGSMSWLYL